MNKEQFLAKLNDALKRLPSTEREDILQDFKEHFEIGLDEGKTEGEIAKGLGSPQQIAREMVAAYRLEQVEETATTGNIFRAVWAVIGLGFFNLLIVLAPFVALVALVLSGWALGVSLVLNPILYLLNVAIYPEIFALYQLFFTVGLAGIGIFMIIGMFYVTRWIIKGFVHYLQFNMKMLKGGMKHA